MIEVSDGNYGLTGSSLTVAAWIIQPKDGEQFISGISTPGYNEGHKSMYRVELVGLSAIVHLTTYLCNQYKIPVGIVHIECDNTNTLTTAFE